MARNRVITKLLNLNSSIIQTSTSNTYEHAQSCKRLFSSAVLIDEKYFQGTKWAPVEYFSKSKSKDSFMSRSIQPSFFGEQHRQFFSTKSTLTDLPLDHHGDKVWINSSLSQLKGNIFLKFVQPFQWNNHISYSTKGTQLSVVKNQSALLVKRSPRKKIPKIHDEGKTRQLNNVVAYALGEEIRLETLKKILLKQGLYSIGELPSDANHTLHVRGKYILDDQRPKEIFVFDDGSVVFWCVPEVERGAFLKLLMKYCEAPYTFSVVLSEREELDFALTKEKTCVMDDVIRLQERPDDDDSNKNVLELYTCSNALAQSVKLSMWEVSLEKFISSIEAVTEDVRHGRKISMSRRQVLKKSGELMSLRHLINLSSDLLDTPDFYWERADLESLYQNMCGQLNTARRTKVINEKLTHCNELVELVSNHLSDEHHTRLEVMIIILIFVEVAIELLNIAKHYLESRSSKRISKEDEVSVSNSED